jgi:serine/threonine protein kinase
MATAGLPDPNTDPRIGTVLSERYRLDALLGEGGMGKVYAAEHVLMKKRLAVKVLHRELTLVPEVVARFEREAMAAANIDHPNVAAATDFGRLSDGSVFLVLEFVQGRSLREEIAAGPMSVERALNIARQIASGLRGAHGHGIVHRDLKPENVMLVDRDGDPDFVKVLDFGVAKVPIGEVPAVTGTPISRAGMVFGTPEYMAPEQALGEPVDGRADLYALGVMLFEMLAGDRPFLSESPVGILGQQLSQAPPLFAERVGPGVVPPVVERAVHRLLARDKDRRPASAREVEDTLSSLLVPSPSGSATKFTLAVGSPVSSDFDRLSTGSLLPGDADEARRSLSSLPPEHAASLMGRLGSVFESLPPRAAALRDRLPTGLRDSLRPVAPRTLAALGLLGAGLVVVLFVAVVVALGRSLFSDPKVHEAAANRPSASASPATPAETAISAPPASSLAAPAVRPPSTGGATQGEVLAASALAESQKQNHATALALVERTLTVEPALSSDDRLSLAVFAAARESSTWKRAFKLLEGPMAGRGAELLWDIASDKRAPLAARQRAGGWLRSANFKKQATPGLLLAAELRTARTCELARDLLVRAKEVGDERSLSQLEAWQARTGCGKKRQDDCMPCLRADVRLEEAIAAIRARPTPPWKSP